MRPLSALACIGLMFLLTPALHAQSSMGNGYYDWARFQPGAWVRLRMVIEKLDESGEVSVVGNREIKMTLISKADNRFTLRTEVKIDVAGRRFDSDPQLETQGFLAEKEDEVVKLEGDAEGNIVINNTKIPCRIKKYQIINGDPCKRFATVYFSDKVYPYILKNSSRVVNEDDETSIAESVVEVIALDMPWKVLANIERTAHIRTTRRIGKKSEVQLDVNCPKVPGGLVSRSKKEINELGRMEARTTIELIDYSVEGEAVRTDAAIGRRFLRQRVPKRRTR